MKKKGMKAKATKAKAKKAPTNIFDMAVSSGEKIGGEVPKKKVKTFFGW